LVFAETRTLARLSWLQPAGDVASHFTFDLTYQGFAGPKMSTSPTPNNPPLVCSTCHERSIGTHFCASCGKMLQPSAGTDYFATFGLPRKLTIDVALLEQKFLQLSWKLHPDNFVSAPESDRELSLKRSSELNDAYRVLRDPVARVEYLLGIEGERVEGEKKQQAPPELLEEVFELNESLDELREAKESGSDLIGLKSRLESAEDSFEEKLTEVDLQLQSVAKDWDMEVDANAEYGTRKKLFARMNELLNRRSYIRNLVTNVGKELAEV
jgi:molecular chaperone HscB